MKYLNSNIVSSINHDYHFVIENDHIDRFITADSIYDVAVARYPNSMDDNIADGMDTLIDLLAHMKSRSETFSCYYDDHGFLVMYLRDMVILFAINTLDKTIYLLSIGYEDKLDCNYSIMHISGRDSSRPFVYAKINPYEICVVSRRDVPPVAEYHGIKILKSSISFNNDERLSGRIVMKVSIDESSASCARAYGPDYRGAHFDVILHTASNIDTVTDYTSPDIQKYRATIYYDLNTGLAVLGTLARMTDVMLCP